MKHGTHIPRKRFGQHFLADRAIIDAIVQAIDPKPGDAMVEIGPGLAALTQPLVERLGALTVIESSVTGNMRLSDSVFNLTPCSSNHLTVSAG